MRGPGPKDFRCTRHFEAHLGRRGWRLIAGCDEAGRGALIGPVYAAAVILDPAKRIHGVDDSKKLAPEVDQLNVYQASRRAMIRALEALVPAPDFVLTDAMRLAGWGDAIDFPIP